MPDQPSPWPEVPPEENVELTKVLFRAQVEETARARQSLAEKEKARREADGAIDKARREADVALEKADWAAEYELDKLYQTSIFEVAKGTIDRARGAAEMVQKGAAAVGTIYTGLLAVSFSVTERPLPARGAIPAIFLGLALALSTAYVSYLREAGAVEAPQPHSSNRVNQAERIRAFVRWVSATVSRRSYFLRASVIALGFGVLFLPFAFLSVGADQPMSEAAAPARDWPLPDPRLENVELQKILYKAQVSLFVEEAKTSAPPGPEDEDWAWASFWVGLAVMILLPMAFPTADRGAGWLRSLPLFAWKSPQTETRRPS